MTGPPPTPPSAPPPPSRKDLLFLASFALLKVLIHLPVLGRYGYHHDELYFLACGQHLSWGYVDHAPLVPWIARLIDELFAGDLFWLRLPAVLAGAAAIFFTGLLARRLGGGRFAQAAACLGLLVAPVYLRTANLLHLPAFEVLFWSLAFYLLARILQEDRPRLWLAVGLVAGLGLLNKHTMLLFGFGLASGLALTPARRHFRSPWLWAGGAVAILLFLPNLLWQAANGWPTVEFLRQLNDTRMSAISGLQFVAGQLLYLNPVTAPLWLAGLVFFFRPAGRPWRVLGWIYVSIAAALLVLGSKIYYLAPTYPALLAGGGVAVEAWARRPRRAWLRPAAVGALLAGGLVLAPLSLPLLPIDATERYIRAATFGAFEDVYELTADLRGMFAWEERAELAAQVWRSLRPEERERAVIVGRWYGTAGAVDFFGRRWGLPPVVSTHLSYHLWGLPDHPVDTLVAVDIPREDLDGLCAELTVAAEAELEQVNPWERHFQVSICRGIQQDIRAMWPGMRRY